MIDNPNYCQDPECHNPRVAYYTERYSTGTATHPPRVDGHWISWARQTGPGWRRWCRSHALINEGVAFG